MAYGKIKMGKAKPMPIGLDDLRNRSKKPPKPGTRPGPLTPRTPGGPGKREKRPLPKPITKPFDLRKEKQLPRKPLNESGLKKDGPVGKKGSPSMSVKKPLLISRKKIGGR